MGATQTRLSERQVLLQSYRDAFRQFRREANRLIQLQARDSYDRAETEAALSRLEQAHMVYNEVRDHLAAHLMSPGSRAVFWTIPQSTLARRRRVENVAELLWELSGKPQGTADDDWYRAERVLQYVDTEVCAAAR